ncbi:MAG: hypothetical protein FWC91_07760 [Defluviitaleaceae bacterium]|nr:hypothetical protein [Defluviitaleaceae bacterium]
MPKTNQLTVRIYGRCINVDKRITIYKSAEIVSYESLLESGFDCPGENDSVEEIVISAVLKDDLRHALNLLTDEERLLIDELYFSNDGEGMTDNQYSKISGIPRTTINHRKKIIISKLKKFIEIPSSP